MFAIYVGLTLGYNLYTAKTANSKSLVKILIYLVTIVTTWSVTGFVAVAFLMVFYLLFYFRMMDSKEKIFWISIILITLTLALKFGVFNYLYTRIQPHGPSEDSVLSRVYSIIVGTIVGITHPFFGTGSTNSFIEFSQRPTISIQDVIAGNYTEEDLQISLGRKYATVAGLVQVDSENMPEVRKFVKKLGAEMCATFDSQWAHGDADRIKQIEEQQKKDKEEPKENEGEKQEKKGKNSDNKTEEELEVTILTAEQYGELQGKNGDTLLYIFKKRGTGVQVTDFASRLGLNNDGYVWTKSKGKMDDHHMYAIEVKERLHI